MKAGPLRRRIALESPVRAPRDSMGGEALSWVTEAVVPASIEPLIGREYFQAEQVQSEVEVRFRIRWFNGIKPEWRIVFEDTYYDIVSIIDYRMQHVEMVLMAKSQKL